jgi:hypothetical protein
MTRVPNPHAPETGKPPAPPSPPLPFTARKDQRRIAELEDAVAKLEQKIAAVRVCLQERRLGDALALTMPSSITAPISDRSDP